MFYAFVAGGPKPEAVFLNRDVSPNYAQESIPTLGPQRMHIVVDRNTARNLAGLTEALDAIQAFLNQKSTLIDYWQ